MSDAPSSRPSRRRTRRTNDPDRAFQGFVEISDGLGCALFLGVLLVIAGLVAIPVALLLGALDGDGLVTIAIVFGLVLCLVAGVHALVKRRQLAAWSDRQLPEDAARGDGVSFFTGAGAVWLLVACLLAAVLFDRVS